MTPIQGLFPYPDFHIALIISTIYFTLFYVFYKVLHIVCEREQVINKQHWKPLSAEVGTIFRLFSIAGCNELTGVQVWTELTVGFPLHSRTTDYRKTESPGGHPYQQNHCDERHPGILMNAILQ